VKEWIKVLKAADAAARWHVHQRRKGTAKEPYVNHLLEVATLVAEGTDAEVTDDKTLEKAERKTRQVETAHKKSQRAKILKLADKTSDLRALVSSPAPEWSVRRKIEYIEWARNVVQGLRGANAALEKQFDEAARAGSNLSCRRYSRCLCEPLTARRRRANEIMLKFSLVSSEPVPPPVMP
jgi:(p)ppGpp synthase/HD superfamily hydrolase